MEWWRTHKFEDKDCEQERQTRLIQEVNAWTGRKTLVQDRVHLQVAKTSELGTDPVSAGLADEAGKGG